MTRPDIENIWKLLAIFRPGDKRIKDEKLKSAWLLVLEPYTPQEVKAAVAAYFRESGYWPDVSDIAMRCPKLAAAKEMTDTEIRIREDLERMRRYMAKLKEAESSAQAV